MEVAPSGPPPILAPVSPSAMRVFESTPLSIRYRRYWRCQVESSQRYFLNGLSEAARRRSGGDGMPWSVFPANGETRHATTPSMTAGPPSTGGRARSPACVYRVPGFRYVYRGPCAEKVAVAVPADGGRMTVQDLAAYEVRWDAPEPRASLPSTRGSSDRSWRRDGNIAAITHGINAVVWAPRGRKPRVRPAARPSSASSPPPIRAPG